MINVLKKLVKRYNRHHHCPITKILTRCLVTLIMSIPTPGQASTIGAFLTDNPHIANLTPTQVGEQHRLPIGDNMVRHFAYQLTSKGVEYNTPIPYMDNRGVDHPDFTIGTLRAALGDASEKSASDFLSNLTLLNLFTGLGLLHDPMETMPINGQRDGDDSEEEEEDDDEEDHNPLTYIAPPAKNLHCLNTPFYGIDCPIVITGQFRIQTWQERWTNKAKTWGRRLTLLAMGSWFIYPLPLKAAGLYAVWQTEKYGI